MIDPAESLLAITGIGFLTGERKAAISEEEIRRAAKLPETIVAKCKSTVNQSLERRAPAGINFKRSLASLTTLQGHAQHVERMEKFPRGYTKLGIAYNVLLHQMQAEVAKMLPRQVLQTIVGPEVGPPSDLSMWRFLSILQMIDEPLTVFRLIANGQLLKKQALALKTVYPTLGETITTELFEAVTSKRATSRDWRPGWILEKGLAAWFESSPMSPETLQRLQASHVLVAQRQSAANGAKGATPPPDAQSPSQRAQFGKIE